MCYLSNIVHQEFPLRLLERSQQEGANFLARPLAHPHGPLHWSQKGATAGLFSLAFPSPTPIAAGRGPADLAAEAAPAQGQGQGARAAQGGERERARRLALEGKKQSMTPHPKVIDSVYLTCQLELGSPGNINRQKPQPLIDGVPNTLPV